MARKPERYSVIDTADEHLHMKVVSDTYSAYEDIWTPFFGFQFIQFQFMHPRDYKKIKNGNFIATGFIAVLKGRDRLEAYLHRRMQHVAREMEVYKRFEEV